MKKMNPHLMAMLATLLLSVVPSCSFAQSGTGTELKPLVDGGSSNVSKPDKVKVDSENNIVIADTLQDAVNTAMERNVQTAKKKGVEDADTKASIVKKRDFSPNIAKVGAWVCATPSGELGFMATGTASYGAYKNDDATLLAQRKSYMVAYMEAKGFLTALQRKTKIEGDTDVIPTKLNAMINSEESIIKTVEAWNESLKSSVEGIVRGCVIYEVQDDVDTNGKGGTVFVTIVSSPKTYNRMNRVASDKTLTPEGLDAGIKQIREEIKIGVLPPVGYICLSVPNSTEMAWIGYGSDIVLYHNDALAQKQLAKTALTAARLKAQHALVAALDGEAIAASDDYKSGGQEGLFNLSKDGDPLNDNNTAEISNFYQKTDYEKFIKSRVKGQLPEGVSFEQMFINDNAWAVCIAIYTPSATERTRQVIKDMDSQYPPELQDTFKRKIPNSGPTGKTKTVW